MIKRKKLLTLIFFVFSSLFCSSQTGFTQVVTIPYDIYPEVIEYKPDLPSPFITIDGKEYVIAVTNEKKYAIIEVTLNNNHGFIPKLYVDTTDFPELAQTGMHAEERLNSIKTITGRSLEEITELGHPNGLSQDGFMAYDENIIAVIKGDNRIVSQLGLTHPQLAKPLFYVLNMMDTDLALDRWNMAKHRWENIRCFYYNGHQIFVEAEDTKGGQKSIFDDNIEGGFFIRLWREFDTEELEYLKEHYGYLKEDELNDLKIKLSIMNTGEIEPQYIMRYGFYEGHTFWRTDPIAISFIFGLRRIEELDRLFNGRLYKVLTGHFTE